eukprot:CAMPEP_0185754210 /NCGR_PEP_ID=MMETSP1174-20130828/12854_1 /TAXON_ID=35687 /ORGANISM="Dictyocha speculum, Strain CCMP1381" /LENGTH=60 /DNA_ID=CAMNT_0028432321 /DNA_START=75 /DNA_END=255 /DNA_ORIENTATION=+
MKLYGVVSGATGPKSVCGTGTEESGNGGGGGAGGKLGGGIGGGIEGKLEAGGLKVELSFE